MRNHYTKENKSKNILFVCLAVVAIALSAIFVFGMAPRTVFTFLLILACPLLHVWMMASGGHKP